MFFKTTAKRKQIKFNLQKGKPRKDTVYENDNIIIHQTQFNYLSIFELFVTKNDFSKVLQQVSF